MNKNLENTKKKIAKTFVLVIFVVILIMWILVFSWKFIKDYNFTKTNFKNNSTLISKSLFSNNPILEEPKRSINQNIKKPKDWSKIKNALTKRSIRNNPINFLYFDEVWNLKLNRTFERIESDILEHIEYEKLIFKDWFFVQIKKDNEYWEIFFYKKLNYTFWNLFSDILLLLIFLSIFSGIFYYLVLKFISKIFIPVEENLDDMKNFIHNAGHELKTPISAISSNLQLLKATKKYDKELILEWIEQINNMDKLINYLQELSIWEEILDKENILVKKYLKNLIKLNSFDENIEIKFNEFKDFEILANKNHFETVFWNLIKNALSYNKKNNSINIELWKNFVKVTDFWIWIKKENLDKIFDKFYRVEENRAENHFGIWLSLVKKICEINSWKISVKSELWEGSEFLVEFF